MAYAFLVFSTKTFKHHLEVTGQTNILNNVSN